MNLTQIYTGVDTISSKSYYIAINPPQNKYVHFDFHFLKNFDIFLLQFLIKSYKSYMSYVGLFLYRTHFGPKKSGQQPMSELWIQFISFVCICLLEQYNSSPFFLNSLVCNYILKLKDFLIDFFYFYFFIFILLILFIYFQKKVFYS